LGNEKLIKTTSEGEYWRLLAPGRYTLVAEALGFASSEPFEAFIAEKALATNHNFVLRKL